jgi:hypothetical protein
VSEILDSLLDAERRGDCAWNDRNAIEQHARREVARAREAVNRLTRPRRIPGISHTLGYWAEVNHCEACIRDALRAHLFARGRSYIQTFGTAMQDHIRERGMA